MRILLVCALGLLAAAASFAQAPAATPVIDPARQPHWRCELPGGVYDVALRSIVSVSSHEYIVDAAARVTEVNVDTNGAMTVRFYFLEPLTTTAPLGIGQSALDRIQELTKEATTRTGTDFVWQKVIKNYPATTHARTIEFRLESKDQLARLLASAEKAFRTGVDTAFKLP